MFVTTFMRSFPEGAAGGRGYQRLVAGGKVPGDTKNYAVTRAEVTSWREGVKVLDSGMATVLQVSEVICCCC